MISKIGILVIAACVYSSAGIPPPPDCSCTRDFDQVCGADGVTYNNDCLRACAGVEPKHPGQCGAAPAAEPECRCTKEMKPVCGNDGTTYGNTCELNCATAKNSALAIAYNGPCNTPQTDCVCTAQYEPVCGSDGKTYSNDCRLNCATAQNPGLKVAHSGECENKETPCICTREMKPVCGSNGKTYNNKCLLDCAASEDSSITLARVGKCLTVKVVDPIRSQCICTQEYSPVCGSDGKRYSNQCALNCAKRENPDLVPGACSPPPCVCLEQYEPVCGSDGKTYGNDCKFKCASNNNLALSLAHAGECEAPQTPCICTREMNPVCGSDGNTYNNKCLLNCAADKDPSITFARVGKCLNVKVVDPVVPPIPQTPCVCTREMKPVCGSDGNTYDNKCLLNCAADKDPSVTLSRVGRCLTVKVVDPAVPPTPQTPCVCTREMRPVCGSDGNTYNNKCLLDCAADKDPSITLSRVGKCLTVKVVDPNPSCVCTFNYLPVCGSDGKTYSNECLLNCATAQNSRLSIARQGECEKVPEPACVCTDQYQPVCGSDGKTYPNDCELNCATAKDSGLKIASQGECQKVPEPTCACTREMEQVCGSDGKTYNNVCLLNCATAQDSTLRVSHPGACSDESEDSPDCE